MAARASIRVSIAWSGADAIEDTDTLVMTIDGYSLDLRVFVSGPDTGSIDWSTVAHVSEIEGSTKENPILKWDHIIDSRPETDLPDQGSFATLPNGDVTEIGTMFNPKTNDYEPYVETWRRLQLPTSAPYLVLQRDESEQVDGPKVQAFLGRVGEHALGLAKTSDGSFLAWRDRVEDGQWKRVYQFGSNTEMLKEWLPSLPIDTSEEWSKGNTVQLGSGKWEVKTVGSL
ncbi:uncharacterized protein IL334_003041 [Kwoniella shivajii]|uniref:Protein HRI1 n=1 Tax=Kwoniella shivajii TaxID=564305 RepID=A0ABZ1CX02_9TREE|nr:hypothetical protein IL334_003041 [Kwoniella shivajii]